MSDPAHRCRNADALIARRQNRQKRRWALRVPQYAEVHQAVVESASNDSTVLIGHPWCFIALFCLPLTAPQALQEEGIADDRAGSRHGKAIVWRFFDLAQVATDFLTRIGAQVSDEQVFESLRQVDEGAAQIVGFAIVERAGSVLCPKPVIIHAGTEKTQTSV